MKKPLIGLFAIGITGITYLTVSVLSQQTTPLANADNIPSQASQEETTDDLLDQEHEVETTDEEQSEILADLEETASRLWEESLEEAKMLQKLRQDLQAIVSKHHKKDVTIGYEYDRDMMQLLMDTLKTKKLEKQEIKAIKDYLYEWVVATDPNETLGKEIRALFGSKTAEQIREQETSSAIE